MFKEDCIDINCCGNGSCDNVCPYKDDFVQRWQEVGGLCFDDIRSIEQRSIPLPRYVPVIKHGYGRSDLLDCPVVAISTYQIFRKDKAGVYRPIAKSPESVRSMFRLQPTTKIILRGTAKDPPLQRYWKYRRRDDAPRLMADLDTSLIIGPNFSHFLDVPRTDNLFNRKRQLICLAELAAAGLNPVPHLNAVTPADWSFWKEFLRSSATISHVALEFQTGNKSSVEGTRVVERLARMRDELGRSLKPICEPTAHCFVQKFFLPTPHR